MIAAFLTILLALTPYQAANQVSVAQKKEFIKLLQTLPYEGEFYTDEGIEKAGPLPACLICAYRKRY